MPADPLASKLLVYGRDQEARAYLRDYSLRFPSAATGDGTQPYLEAQAHADRMMALYANSVRIANATTRATARGKDLDEWAKRMGTARLPAAGAAGYITISTSSGGTRLFAGDEFKIGNLRYAVLETNNYANGNPVGIYGVDVGPSTTQRAGTIGRFTFTRPGCNPNATVVAQADGSGLKGGVDVESDDELRLRLDQIAANPPASGNEAQYQQAVLLAPGVGVQAAFTYGCIKGPGSMGVVFTLRPSYPGASRIPSGVHIALVNSWLKSSLFPLSDMAYVGTLVGSPVTIALQALWSASAAGWIDAIPWPAIASPLVQVSSVTSATQLRLVNVVSAPSAGQTVAFFDAPFGVFRKKKILTATFVAGTSWDIVCDPTNGSSDLGYTPLVAQPCCPWADSLDTLAPPVLSYFDSLGPGEQISTFFDPGLRQRRSPVPPTLWPNAITNRLLAGPSNPAVPPQPGTPPPQSLFALSSLNDVEISQPALPYATPVGTPAVSSNLLTLANLVAFPE